MGQASEGSRLHRCQTVALQGPVPDGRIVHENMSLSCMRTRMRTHRVTNSDRPSNAPAEINVNALPFRYLDGWSCTTANGDLTRQHCWPRTMP